MAQTGPISEIGPVSTALFEAVVLRVTKRTVWNLVLLLLLLAWPARAQQPPTLANLEISLWPEFDRHEVLVIYRGLFAADTPLPIPVEIRIPASAGQPTAVAYVTEGQRLNQEHTVRQEGGRLVVSFELTTPGFQLEYYDALVTDAEDRREYTFAYTADYPVNALSLDIQVPPTAQEFHLEPAADAVVEEGDGLTYHHTQLSSLEKGDTHTWAFAYSKDNPDLTVALFAGPEEEAAPASPAAPAAAAETGNSVVWIFLIGFAALLAVGAGAFWLGRQTQPLAETPQRRQKRRGSGRRSALPPPGTPVDDEVRFCHKCGAQLRPDAEFCHQCGASVRR